MKKYDSLKIYYDTHLLERENNPQTFVYERDILAEAQVSLKNAWKLMEKFLASSPKK